MLYRGEKRFNGFLHSVEGINPNTLATRLKEMEGNRLITRKVYDETPVRVEYHLTEKGRDLLPILDQMATYSMKHAPAIFASGRASSFQKVCRGSWQAGRKRHCIFRPAHEGERRRRVREDERAVFEIPPGDKDAQTV